MKKANLFYALLIGLTLLSNTLLSISFAEIEVWIGEGENQAGLIIDWEDELAPTTLAWGYRWDGEKNGQDMLSDIIAGDPRLSGDALLPETLNYDLNNDGNFDSNDHMVTADMNNGNFWAYYSGTDGSTWNFSNVGHAGRTLVDGEWDGWLFIEDWTAMPYPEIDEAIPAEAAIEEELSFNELVVWAGEGENEAMLVIDFNADNDPESYAWGFRWDGEADGTAMMNAVSELDPRLTITLSSSFLTKIELDTDNDGIVDYGIYDDGDYWSTWSRGESFDWSWNSGCSTILENKARFGCSYGFDPESTQPDNPIAMAIIPVVENEAPVAFNEVAIVKNSGNNLLPILLNDEDADENMVLESIVITTQANNGTVLLNEDGTVTYSSEAGYEGDDSFSYTVADSVGAVSNVAVCELSVVTPFSGVVGTDGCEAIAVDSGEFVSWATGIELERGFIDISDESAGYVTYGTENDALGQAEGTSMNVVSLGDGGNAILTFEEAICDEEGADFAIFENSFNSTFLELAFVEVSSDGETFFRFPATSYTQLFTQITDSNAILAEDIHNLAGKYMQGYGTPFDLADLAGTEGLDINQISHVKVIDAIGSLNADYASYDSNGTMVNEPWPTISASGGFDLDGVGVIHQTPIVSSPDTPELVIELKNSYPNPFMPGNSRAGVQISFSILKAEIVSVKVFNIKGQQVATVCDRKFSEGYNTVSWNGKDSNGDIASSGVYFYRMETNGFKQTKRLMIVK